MGSIKPRLRALLDAEQAAASAMSQMADSATAAGVRVCLRGLHDTATWLSDGLAKRIARATKRRSTSTHTVAGLTDQLMIAPADADRLRLLNRHQRSVLARVDRLLLERIDVDLRTFLQEAHGVLARSVAQCDEAIAGLDREREVHRESDASTPGRSL